MFRRFVKSVVFEKIVDEFFDAFGRQFYESSEAANSCFRNIVPFQEFNVNHPDSVVLRDGKSAKSPIECSSSSRDVFLATEPLAVVCPDSRHFVHEHKSALVSVICIFVCWVLDRKS